MVEEYSRWAFFLSDVSFVRNEDHCRRLFSDQVKLKYASWKSHSLEINKILPEITPWKIIKKWSVYGLSGVPILPAAFALTIFWRMSTQCYVITTTTCNYWSWWLLCRPRSDIDGTGYARFWMGTSPHFMRSCLENLWHAQCSTSASLLRFLLGHEWRLSFETSEFSARLLSVFITWAVGSKGTETIGVGLIWFGVLNMSSSRTSVHFLSISSINWHKRLRRGTRFHSLW